MNINVQWVNDIYTYMLNSLGTILWTLPNKEIWDGIPFNQSLGVGISETYIDTLFSITSCDSIIITEVTSYPKWLDTNTVTICSSSNYELPDGLIVSSPGQYITSFSSKFGCDSIIVTNLFVNNQQSFTNILGNDNPTQFKTYFYSIDSFPNHNYLWNVLGGNIIGNFNTPKVEVQWTDSSFGNLSVGVSDIDSACNFDDQKLVTIKKSDVGFHQLK